MLDDDYFNRQQLVTRIGKVAITLFDAPEFACLPGDEYALGLLVIVK